MLTEERHKKIIEWLERDGLVKSQDLIQWLNSSESTVRRDLHELEELGLLERIHGGAKRPQHLEQELGMDEKSSKNVQQKKIIAKYAANLLSEGDVIYLDAGTTTSEMIPFMKKQKVTIVTNSVGLAAHLVEAQIATIVLGGRIKLTTDAVVGSQALEQLKQYRFNKAFMGMNGIHSDSGYSTPDPEEAILKRTAIQQAEEAFVLVDHSKFNQTSFVRVASLSAASILTDTCPLIIRDQITEQTTLKEVSV
ncbi:DeoR/GlpR family DNA-binding transcription regulator [Enterococcus dongliensis]|uniref:DeoR/GlpR family DNA-binding transcription regulator n=1 Tax=Enterococcus dongliensis TaxID=2559925 RepID=A0AAP5NKC2_9ENTE|nr:DeoR/GlpR family DNA-binding transcription regulator [Enterococcus dongliensis]MDT2595858.1 DeoR/GlpR family DNA-binding transcription regulator [Enterococcus dongliensis]MDT2602881.1 DeoR/GlpR family DNA-binding transcription regulator [Enterococcus dongliensis]MDT2633925.1 DeoR/GlpR family DNA-binding transcription regulator [Enterococcus dongliensis]MDT2637313.1 DeoR/GlpR family DNA-binding transcription regulator [Enterococcus dongliensis]MDT2639653.1 DeoR/GlpR family DNA-binding transc